MIKKLIVTNKRGMRMQGIMFITVAHKHRLQGNLLGNRCPKQFVKKPFQSFAIRCRAFGKEEDIAALTQVGRQLELHLAGITRPSLNEERPGDLGQPSHYRPTCDFSLGEKIHREICPQNGDIEP